MTKPQARSSTKNTELAEALAFCFSDEMIQRAFFEGCLLEQLKQTVENNGPLLADTNERSEGKKEFTEEELQMMKTCRLGDITYTEIEDSKTFKVNLGNGKALSFSNRTSTRNELRGPILREAIDNLKNSYPDLSLYEGLTILLHNPDQQLDYLYPPLRALIQGYNQDLDLPKEVLANLIKACMKYVETGRSQGITDDQLIKTLSMILTEKGREVFLQTLDSPSSDKSIFKLLKIKEVEINIEQRKKAEKWIEEIDLLQEKYPQHQALIADVAITAKQLLAWQKNGEQNKLEGQQERLALNFQIAVDNVQHLQLEKLSWKNVFSAFLVFIPNVINYIKTGSFWYNTNSSIKAKNLLTATPKALTPTTPKEEQELSDHHRSPKP